MEKEVVAFLNYKEGGIIYIGVDDSGKAIGVKDIDNDMLKIKDRIRKGISPLKNYKLTERQLLIVDIIKNGAVNDPINDPINDTSNRLLIASKLKVSEATVKREIADLIKLGVIKRVGSNKTGHWEVN